MENNENILTNESLALSSVETSSLNIETVSTSSIFDNLTLFMLYDDFNGIVYVDKDNYYHLFINNIEMTNVNNAIEIFMYDKEYWLYRDVNKFVHLFKNNIELTKDIKTMGVLQDPRSDQWFYANDKNKLILLSNNK